MEARVIKFNQSKVPDMVQKFLDVHGMESENTSAAYEKDIKDFARIVIGKTIDQLNEEDLINISIDDFEDFQLELVNSGLTHPTINRKVQTIKSLLSNLNARMKDIEIDTSYFKEVKKLKGKSKPWHALSVDETRTMAQLAEDTEREMGTLKKYFILFALDTCIRLNAIRSLTWDNFVVDGETVIIEGVDKGNKYFVKGIKKWFYDELLSLKKDGNEKVFDISKDSINDSIKRLTKRMGIDNRRIVFHSIRKAGITNAWEVTGDPLAAMEAGNHSDFNTTLGYIKAKDYGVIGAYSSSKDIGIDIIDQVSHEELLNAINELPKDAQFILAKKLHELKK